MSNLHPIFQRLFNSLGFPSSDTCVYCNRVKPCTCIRTQCGWCGKVLKDVPQDKRGVSHGMCDDCGKQFAEGIEKP